MRVRDVMQEHVVTLGLEDSLDVADDIMTLGRVRHLPVVVGESRLVGVVSQRDLLKASLASVLGLGRAVEHDWLKKIPVRTVMTTEVDTASPNDSLKSAVDRMISKKIGCLPVVEHGKLLGLVTETDCLEVLSSTLANDPPIMRSH
jgi:CBS domain-containing membrane protein